MKTVEIKLTPDEINDEQLVQSKLKAKLQLQELPDYYLDRKSIDARQRQVYYRLRYVVGGQIDQNSKQRKYKNVSNAESAVIIGAGPAGYFAALKMIELGLKPIILERGKDVQTRRRDLRAIQQYGEVNRHSNYCFGEGGAGTYSDGKLYTRSHKRGNIQQILEIFHEHGAKDDVLYDAHPHIGSNKLPHIVRKMRETILHFGGEIHFDSWVVDMTLTDNRITNVILETGEKIASNHFVFATGHSARDIYYLLDKKGIQLEQKDFAIGVRIEHPQSLIDQIMYRQNPRHENLPAASYRIACEIDSKGVFSFCMCPGGLIVPASTAPGELVVNGMSLSKRDSAFANSGFVTAVTKVDFEQFGYRGIFAGLEYQKNLEQTFFNYGDGTQKAPAQNLIDFIESRSQRATLETSYIPGIYQAPLHDMLPEPVFDRMKKALNHFSRRMPNYISDSAQLIGLESRTSSPIRIPRNQKSLSHPQIDNLYPCAEGAGYAGGILSAAMDGQKIAMKIGELESKEIG